jgi:hypothetical protein
MPAVALLPEGSPKPDRSRVMTQTKRDTLVLQVGSWARGRLLLPVKHILVSNPLRKREAIDRQVWRRYLKEAKARLRAVAP